MLFSAHRDVHRLNSVFSWLWVPADGAPASSWPSDTALSNTLSYKTGQTPRCRDPLQAFRNLLSPTQLAPPMVQTFNMQRVQQLKPQSVTAHHEVPTHRQRLDASMCAAQGGVRPAAEASFFEESRNRLDGRPLKITQQIVVKWQLGRGPVLLCLTRSSSLRLKVLLSFHMVGEERHHYSCNL